MKKIAFFLSLLLVLGVDVFAVEPVNIRVAVLKGVASVTFAVLGPFDIIDTLSGHLIYSANYLSSTQGTFVAGGFKFKTKILASTHVTLHPKKPISIFVNKRQYRGDISFIKDVNGELTIVNTLDLESYVKGVLYHEISHKWSMDAIKAQAVACRTYAMHQKGLMLKKDYDVSADTSSQVYGGYGSEKDKTNRAVDLTRGEVMRYKAKVFPAYFHATCAGSTEDAGELWKIDILPLKGNQRCSFCVDSPHYYWKNVTNLKDIREKLGSLYKLSGDLKDISIIEKNTSGRIRRLKLTDSLGQDEEILAKDFRQLIGPDIIRSTNFSILIDADKAKIEGRGWGHGVGLCQWGAQGMSKAGYTYKQILAFYYPGSEIATI